MQKSSLWKNGGCIFFSDDIKDEPEIIFPESQYEILIILNCFFSKMLLFASVIKRLRESFLFI